ncbi:MAG TPA: hypothetical protein DCE71_01780 [Parachlamydiales bacterium]|nr:hypothetical protein [Parachlamydiales bacterium]
MTRIIYDRGGEVTVSVCPYNHVYINEFKGVQHNFTRALNQFRRSVYINEGKGVQHINYVGNIYVGFGPFPGEPEYDGYLFRPAIWCKEKWKDWAGPWNSMDNQTTKTLLKIAVFIPLVLISIVAFFLKLVGLFTNWHTYVPGMPLDPKIQ